MTFLGVIASMFFVLCFTASIVRTMKDEDEISRQLDLQMAIWFVAICICFK